MAVITKLIMSNPAMSLSFLPKKKPYLGNESKNFVICFAFRSACTIFANKAVFCLLPVVFVLGRCKGNTKIRLSEGNKFIFMLCGEVF